MTAPSTRLLRETEEVGIHRRHIDIVGQLDLYRTRTGFKITPVVGLLTPPFRVKADPMEVQEIFEVPLNFFLDRKNHERHSREWNNQTRSFYAMPYGDYYIWGATAGMLVNFVDVLRPTSMSVIWWYFFTIWMTASETRAVMDVLNGDGDMARFVGGCVRSAVLDLPISDIDIATRHRPERTTELLEGLASGFCQRASSTAR